MSTLFEKLVADYQCVQVPRRSAEPKWWDGQVGPVSVQRGTDSFDDVREVLERTGAAEHADEARVYAHLEQGGGIGVDYTLECVPYEDVKVRVKGNANHERNKNWERLPIISRLFSLGPAHKYTVEIVEAVELYEKGEMLWNPGDKINEIFG